MRVVILGGGEYGFSLAQMISGWNCKVRIFERDPVLAESIAEQLTGAIVINADATSVAELREEQVGEADFFITTTQSDEDNVMTCLQAANLGTKHCLALIHRTDYADALSQAGEQLGITAAVSPREATRRELMRFITSDKYHVVKKVRAGEVVEILVRENSKADGCHVGEIAWPEGCVLVALIKGIHATVPAAEDTIDAGDTLYAMVSKKGKKGLVKLVTK
jgi:trk system potassium uptake protein TrkA